MIKTNSGRRLRICDRFTNVVLNLSQKLERQIKFIPAGAALSHRAERARASRASCPVSSPVSAICKPAIPPIRHSANLPFPIPTEPSPHRANPPTARTSFSCLARSCTPASPPLLPFLSPPLPKKNSLPSLPTLHHPSPHISEKGAGPSCLQHYPGLQNLSCPGSLFIRDGLRGVSLPYRARPHADAGSCHTLALVEKIGYQCRLALLISFCYPLYHAFIPSTAGFNPCLFSG